jgi:hypothetical protein
MESFNLTTLDCTIIPISKNAMELSELLRDCIGIGGVYLQTSNNIPITIPEFTGEHIRKLVEFLEYHVVHQYIMVEQEVNFTSQFSIYDQQFANSIPIQEIVYYPSKGVEVYGIWMRIADFFNIPILQNLLGYKYLDYVVHMSREEKRRYHQLPVEIPEDEFRQFQQDMMNEIINIENEGEGSQMNDD